MKKNGVFIAVFLLLGVFMLMYFAKGKKASPKPPVGGASLVTLSTANPVSQEDLKKLDPGECRKKGLKGIMDDYGVFWGDVKVNYEIVPFSAEDNAAIRELSANYYACKSLIAGSTEQCKALPGKGAFSPAYLCENKYALFPFFEFMLGKKSDISNCKRFFSSDFIKGGEKSETAFCDSARKGMAAICENPEFSGIKDCRKAFPKDKADCEAIKDPEDKQECIDALSLYSALGKADPSGCPSWAREICGAVLKGKEAPCEAIKGKLVEEYCDMYVKAQKENISARSKVPEKKKAGK